MAKTPKLEDISGKKIPENLKLIATKNVDISYAGCFSFKDGERIYLEAMASKAPRGARFFSATDGIPDRAALGLAGSQPIQFSHSVNYYS